MLTDAGGCTGKTLLTHAIARETGSNFFNISAKNLDPGTHFTCLTGTKVQILTQKALRRPARLRAHANTPTIVQKYKY